MHGYNVTEAELAVLQLLWEQAPQSVRQISDQLYPAGTNSDIATVQKLLQRLEKKGIVTRDRSQHAHLFSSTISKTEFAGAQLAEMADKLSDGSLTPLLLHLVESNRINSDERNEIRELLDRFQDNQKTGRKK